MMIKAKNTVYAVLLLFILSAADSSMAALEYKIGDYLFGFSGYFRGGLGTSEGGKSQAAFGLPGACTKYRPGNEPANFEL